ncbi:MAG: hypothetical protein ABJC79_05345 [Acidimicrobiia bacterium]
MARFLAAESRQQGLTVPAFRSPPRVSGVSRTIRRLRDGAVVSVQLRGRTAEEVAADMIDGIVITNRLAPGAAQAQVRDRLLAAVSPVEVDLVREAAVDAESAAGRILPAHARMAERQTQAA